MKEKKTETMRFRCTPSDKRKIEKKAEERNVNTTDYMLESSLTGERHVSRIRKDYLCHVVHIQERINRFRIEVECQGDFIAKPRLFTAQP